MEEEKPVKLKLRKKKAAVGLSAQEPEIKLLSSPVVDVRQSSAGSWFDEIDLTSVECLWKQVLIGVSPDLRSVGWGAVPSLPDFTRQIHYGCCNTEGNVTSVRHCCGDETVEKDEKITNTEKFTVGDQTFEWFPFPTPCLCSCPEPYSTTSLNAKNCGNIEQLAEFSLSNSSKLRHQSLNDHLESKIMNSESKQNNQVCSEGPTDFPESNQSLQNGASESFSEPLSLETSSSTTVKEPLASQKCFAKNIKDLQSLQKGLTNSVKEPLSSQKGSKKASKKRHCSQKVSRKNVIVQSELLPKQTDHLWPTVTFAKSSKAQQGPTKIQLSVQGQPRCGKDDMMEDIKEEGASANNKRLKKSADNVTEVTESLKNCPICLLQFSTQFTQLDMDSHLAQCLSEMTDDVVW